MLQCEPEEEQTEASSVEETAESPCTPLNSDASERIEQLMSLMDINKDGAVTVEEAIQFWSVTFGEASHQSEDHVRQFFIDGDVDLDGRLTRSEFLRLFERLKILGYSDEDILARCEAIIENGLWDVWKSNRHIVHVRAWEGSQTRPTLSPGSGGFAAHSSPGPAKLHVPCAADEDELRLSTRPLAKRTDLAQPHLELPFEPSDEVLDRGRLDRVEWIWNQVTSASKGRLAESQARFT